SATKQILQEHQVNSSFVTETIPDTKKIHQCTVCLKSFNSPYKLQRHFLIHTGQKPFQCSICGKTFRQMVHLKLHSQTHSKPFDCWECGKTFRQLAHLKVHQETHRNGRDFDNILQEEAFGETGEFDDQDESHSKHLLSNCDESFLVPAQLKLHQCAMCSKYFTSPYKLQRHFLIHTGQRPFDCKACGKTFRQLEHLKLHYLTHTGQKPFRCFACGKEFRQAIHLKVHQRTHNKWRAFKSAFQQQKFLNANRLSSQDQSQGNEKTSQSQPNHDNAPQSQEDTNLVEFRRVYQCSKCLKCFSAPSQLERHCCLCHKSFDCPSKLQRHYLSHTGQKPFECYVCERKFRQLTHLKRHQQSHNGLKKSIRHLSPSILSHASVSQDKKQKQHTDTLRQPSHLKTHQHTLKKLRALKHSYEKPHGQNTNQCLTVNGSLDPAQEANDTVSDEILEECATDSSAKVEDGLKQKEKKHKCSECLKCFSSPSKLERHYLIHAGEKPFECSVCNKSFRQAAHLKVHQRIHAKQFGGSDSLQQEVTNNDFSEDHQGQNMHQSWQLEADSKTCPQYNTNQVAVERSGDDLPELDTASESDYTNGYWSSSSPSGLFKTERKLQVHKCTFKNQTQAKSTSRSLYQCAICFKSFDSPSKLKRHYVIHTGQRPFECSVCRKTFTQSCHLKTHQLTHFK
uniref:C2H2-type domain-containing protein n=1 Tax=Lepisosteus oculatus TaxID=7918 RepID=W5N2Z2_LEPOC